MIRSVMFRCSIFECTTGISCIEISSFFSGPQLPLHRPPRLLYRPAQLLTVSPSNTLHGEALVSVLKPRAWVQEKKEKKKRKEEKKTPQTWTTKLPRTNKSAPLTTLMAESETYSPLNAAGFPFHGLLAGLPLAATSWLAPL